MMSGMASKFRKLSDKSPSKNRALASSGDKGGGGKGADKAPKDMEETFSSSKSQKISCFRSREFQGQREASQSNGGWRREGRGRRHQ